MGVKGASLLGLALPIIFTIMTVLRAIRRL